MRTKIALRNLYISQAIIFLFLIFSYFVWFPYPFTELGGFEENALMLVLVDFVLGPLLVFIVYKEEKKYLKFDINVLLAIQLAAFVFGAYSLYLKRPIYAVFSNDHFKLVNESYANPEKIKFENLKSSFFSKPIMAFTKTPEDFQGLIQFIIDSNIKDEKQLDQLARYYEPYDKHINKVLSKKLDPSIIFGDINSKTLLLKFLDKHGGYEDQYAFFYLIGSNHKKVIFVLNKDNAQPVGVIDNSI